MSGLEEQIFAYPRLEWIARKFDDDGNSWKLMQIRRENFSHFRDWRFQWNAINPFAPLFVCEDFYQFPSNNKSFWPFDGENMPLVSPRNVSRITSTAGVLRDKIDNFLWENNFLSKNFYYSDFFFVSSRSRHRIRLTIYLLLKIDMNFRRKKNEWISIMQWWLIINWTRKWGELTSYATNEDPLISLSRFRWTFSDDLMCDKLLNIRWEFIGWSVEWNAMTGPKMSLALWAWDLFYSIKRLCENILY